MVGVSGAKSKSMSYTVELLNNVWVWIVLNLFTVLFAFAWVVTMVISWWMYVKYRQAYSDVIDLESLNQSLRDWINQADKNRERMDDELKNVYKISNELRAKNVVMDATISERDTEITNLKGQIKALHGENARLRERTRAMEFATLDSAGGDIVEKAKRIYKFIQGKE